MNPSETSVYNFVLAEEYEPAVDYCLLEVLALSAEKEQNTEKLCEFVFNILREINSLPEPNKRDSRTKFIFFIQALLSRNDLKEFVFLSSIGQIQLLIQANRACSSFGQLTYEAALLSVTETSIRKSYPFHPTVIILKDQQDKDDDDEVNRYFKALKKLQPPIRERFIISGPHWICGDIQIDQNGKMSCLLVDSLDLKCSDLGLASVAFKIKKIHPSCDIYVTNFKRQYSQLGCSVFALNDLRNLHTVENYLNEQYKESGLFGYLENSHRKNGSIEIAIGQGLKLRTMEVRLCELPLTMMRAAQSSTLWDKLIPERADECQNINKNREDILTSLDKHMDTLIVDHKPKKVNSRLQYKLNKMGDQIIKFVAEHPRAQMSDLTSRFTVDGFIKRTLPLTYANLASYLDKQVIKILEDEQQRLINNYSSQEEEKEEEHAVRRLQALAATIGDLKTISNDLRKGKISIDTDEDKENLGIELEKILETYSEAFDKRKGKIGEKSARVLLNIASACTVVVPLAKKHISHTGGAWLSLKGKTFAAASNARDYLRKAPELQWKGTKKS